LNELECRHINRVLQHTGGNKTVAARILGIDLRTLQRKLKK
jgi:two-component system response regulator HydG